MIRAPRQSRVHPDGWTDAETVLRALVEAHKINAFVRKNEALTELQKDIYRAALCVLGLPSEYLGDLDV